MPTNGGLQTVKGYVSALVSLYKDPRADLTNQNPFIEHPRGITLKAYIQNIEQSARQKRREEYQDRGLNSGEDTVTYGSLKHN
jgi:hypothetical protein